MLDQKLRHLSCIVMLLYICSLHVFAQELRVKEIFGTCLIENYRDTIEAKTGMILNRLDRLSVIGDSYLILESIQKPNIQIPLSTGDFKCAEILKIVDQENKSLLTFFSKVYSYFINNTSAKSGFMLTGAVSRSECIYQIKHTSLNITSKCSYIKAELKNAENDSLMLALDIVPNKVSTVDFERIDSGIYYLSLSTKWMNSTLLVERLDDFATNELLILKNLYDPVILEKIQMVNCILPKTIRIDE